MNTTVLQQLLEVVKGLSDLAKHLPGQHDQSEHGHGGGGGGQNYSPAKQKQLESAKKWVESQEPWEGKVEVEVKQTDIKALAPDKSVAVNNKTVKKYEKQILKEMAEFGSPQRPLVVHKHPEDPTKLFIDDGNHYYKAIGNLYQAGKIPREALSDLTVVEVVPKKGYHFEVDYSLAGMNVVSHELREDK